MERAREPRRIPLASAAPNLWRVWLGRDPVGHVIDLAQSLAILALAISVALIVVGRVHTCGPRCTTTSDPLKGTEEQSHEL